MRLAAELLHADGAILFTKNQEDHGLSVLASIGLDDGVPSRGAAADYGLPGGLANNLLQTGRSELIRDAQEDQRWPAPAGDAERFVSAIGAPLMINEEAIGALVFLSRGPAAFAKNQLIFALTAAGQMASAIYNAELFQLIRDQASRQGGMIREKQMEASRSHAILEAIAEGVLVTDAGNQVTLFNAAAEQILRLSRDEVLGQSAYAFIGVFGEAGERWMKALRRWNQAPAQATPREQLETQLLLEDGRYVSLTVAPVHFESQFIGTVTTFRDVTQAVEVDRLKSEFVATVSHELRTPMTSVKGYVEMMLMETVGAINDDQRRFLQVIKTNIDRLGGLVNDLLDISRIESGRVQLSLEPVDLILMVRETREALVRKSRIDSKPMVFELDLPASLPPVHGDHDRLRQILTNLVENSYNYTPADGLITVTLAQEDDCIRVSVSDNGIGIKPADQGRVFERFYRGEQALNMSVGGTGLGLSIVRQLIEMHGGSITLQSEGIPGEGTTFSFTVPLYEEAKSEL
jgi:PAS domain S-box-containing protein